jgi:hypothetical protein
VVGGGRLKGGGGSDRVGVARRCRTDADRGRWEAMVWPVAGGRF